MQRKIIIIVMKTRKEIIDLLKLHASELYSRFGIRSMRLFGSVANGTNDEKSDVDLLVEMPGSFHIACDAADYLESLLGCEVDLIRNHENLQPSFLKMIEKYGIDIYTAA